MEKIKKIKKKRKEKEKTERKVREKEVKERKEGRKKEQVGCGRSVACANAKIRLDSYSVNK